LLIGCTTGILDPLGGVIDTLATFASGGTLAGSDSSGTAAGTRETSTGTASLTIVNNSRDPARSLYFAPAGSTYMGNDHLGADVISPGESVTFALTPGIYDLGILDSDSSFGGDWSQDGVTIRGFVTWTLYDLNKSAITTSP
jgi:hypothetical protein